MNKVKIDTNNEDISDYNYAYTDVKPEEVNSILFRHTGTYDIGFEWQGRVLTSKLNLLFFIYAGENSSDDSYFEVNPQFKLFDIEIRDEKCYEPDLDLLFKYLDINLKYQEDYGIQGLTSEQLIELINKL